MKNCTLREVLLADMYEAEIKRLKAELSRYKQGVEMEGEINGLSGIWIDDIRIQQYFDLGQRVRVLVMKEDGDE